VQAIAELFACPHLAARNMFIEIDDPVAGLHRLVRTPLLLDEYDTIRRDTAPQLGAQNDELLEEMAGQR
jgi:crotonobetainyl-CoA:carnitine CoA-transferase CaiB-like acyl-CoA transferase